MIIFQENDRRKREEMTRNVFKTYLAQLVDQAHTDAIQKQRPGGSNSMLFMSPPPTSPSSTFGRSQHFYVFYSIMIHLATYFASKCL